MKHWKMLTALWEPLTKANISLYSSSAAFYLILSFLPASVLFLSLLPYLPVSPDLWLSFLTDTVPSPFLPVAFSLWETIFRNRSLGTASASAFITLWSASKGILSVMDGLNSTFGLPQTGKFIMRHVTAVVYFILLSVCLLVVLICLVFGHVLFSVIDSYYPGLYLLLRPFVKFRGIAAFIVLSILFCLVYRFLPLKRLPLRHCIFSSCVVSAGWIIFSLVFSIYVNYFSGHRRLYGGVGLLILAAIWLRICVSLLMYGGLLAKLRWEGKYHPLRIIRSALTKR